MKMNTKMERWNNLSKEGQVFKNMHLFYILLQVLKIGKKWQMD